MRHVIRDANRQILAVYAEPQPGTEPIAPDDPEVVAFATESDSEAAMRALLASSDEDLIRIVEDLITVLIDQNVILLTDFPAGAQRKLLRRQGVRQKLQSMDAVHPRRGR